MAWFLKGHLIYKRDISSLAVPINRPKSTYKNQAWTSGGHFLIDSVRKLINFHIDPAWSSGGHFLIDS